MRARPFKPLALKPLDDKPAFRVSGVRRFRGFGVSWTFSKAAAGFFLPEISFNFSPCLSDNGADMAPLSGSANALPNVEILSSTEVRNSSSHAVRP